MFTGIIESQAVLREKKKRGKEIRLAFERIGKNVSFRQGESVAVNGVCLTVSEKRGKKFWADAIPETLRSTTLGGLEAGEKVNLERALKAGNRVGGHFVTGHVDGIGFIRQLERRGESFRLRIQAEKALLHFLVPKGSIAIDGISFTLQEIGKRFFTVGVTPHTYRATTLQGKREGDSVNLEIDLFAKMVRRFLSNHRTRDLKEKELRKQGF